MAKDDNIDDDDIVMDDEAAYMAGWDPQGWQKEKRGQWRIE